VAAGTSGVRVSERWSGDLPGYSTFMNRSREYAIIAEESDSEDQESGAAQPDDGQDLENSRDGLDSDEQSGAMAADERESSVGRLVLEPSDRRGERSGARLLRNGQEVQSGFSVLNLVSGTLTENSSSNQSALRTAAVSVSTMVGGVAAAVSDFLTVGPNSQPDWGNPAADGSNSQSISNFEQWVVRYAEAPAAEGE